MMTGRLTTPPTEASLVETLQNRVLTSPDRTLFHFVEDGETETEWLTYAQLDERARAIAAELQRQSLSPGDRVVLVHPPGLEFIAALFGCFYAKMIAVPVYPPRYGLNLDPLRPLVNIMRDCEPTAIMIAADLIEPPRPGESHACDEFTSLRWIRAAAIRNESASQFQLEVITGDTIALLQYTSGSTGAPKGVMVTHANILANEHVIQLAFQHHTAAKMGGGVCWLPFYHDMGLIGNVLQAVYVDGPCWLMSPLALLQHPIRWLQAMTKYRAHSSGGPNFAYELCLRRITDEQKRSLDLSHWELAAIGAEPISASVMDRFAEAFAVCGFRREAFYPCYGLAEATLFVTGGDKTAVPVVRSFPVSQTQFHEDTPTETDRTPPEQDGRLQTLVGCGHAWTEHEIKIVDPTTCLPCPENKVGEIWFRGPSVAKGYWRRDVATEATFHAYLSHNHDGPFLRTGDLGFVSDSELFVAGRIKELIVIRGRNHYPQDLEDSITPLHEAFRPNSTVAMGCVVEGIEQLVILQEIERRPRGLNLEDLAAKIRRVVSEVHQLSIHDIVFVVSHSLPRTTSGKLKRHECRERYQQGSLHLWKPPSPLS